MAIYLDHNSTTPVLPEVAAAMHEALLQFSGNPASQHAAGRQARQVIEEARETVARLLGARTAGMASDRVIFTSGGTEANNLALFGLAGETPAHAIISAIEHPSVTGPADVLSRRGWQIERLPVDSDGQVRVEALADLLRDDTRFVAVMLGNNDTGVLQPIDACSALCRQRGVPLHVDAVQVAGKLPIDFQQLGAATVSIAAHKFHGPRGSGALLVRHDVKLEPLLHGGFQQAGLRPGTEAIAPVVGLQKALELWAAEQDERPRQLAKLRDALEAQLRAGRPEMAIVGEGAPRLPHTSNVAFPGLDRQALVMALDLAGVACSTGSACASGSSEPSPTLVAMGLSEAVLEGSIRLSLGVTTTPAEVAQAAEHILNCCSNLQRQSRRRNSVAAAREPGSNLLH